MQGASNLKLHAPSISPQMYSHEKNIVEQQQIKLVTNRWAWELVPERLAGAEAVSRRGGIHGNPGSGNHPLEAAANRHRHTD